MEIIIKLNDEESRELLANKKTKDLETEPNLSMYAKVFDEHSEQWVKESEYNLIWLIATERYANKCLKAKGYLFLNEVYKMLGMPETKAGNVVGWVYDKKNPIGDNCVDFGIYDKINSDFVNGKKNTAILDFNVDGEIISRL